MNDADPKTPPHEQNSETDLVLRAKYVEYCSAQVAEHLLLLSPDEIYLLAEEAHRLQGGKGEPTYERMVHLPPPGSRAVWRFHLSTPGRRITPVTPRSTRRTSWVFGRVT